MKRIDKENYYLDIAETVLERSTCLRRCYGAIIVKNDEIVSTGYNGAPRGRRKLHGPGLLHPGGHAGAQRRAVRAVPLRPRGDERHHLRRPGGTPWGPPCTWRGGRPKSGELLHDATSCSMCRRVIINAGIDRVVIRSGERDYRVVHVEDWVREDDSLPAKV